MRLNAAQCEDIATVACLLAQGMNITDFDLKCWSFDYAEIDTKDNLILVFNRNNK